jgi:hypothetical protein
MKCEQTKGGGTVVPVHAMKADGGEGGVCSSIALLILNLETRLKTVFSFMLRPLCLPRKNAIVKLNERQGGPQSHLDVWRKDKSCPCPDLNLVPFSP